MYQLSVRRSCASSCSCYISIFGNDFATPFPSQTALYITIQSSQQCFPSVINASPCFPLKCTHSAVVHGCTRRVNTVVSCLRLVRMADLCQQIVSPGVVSPSQMGQNVTENDELKSKCIQCESAAAEDKLPSTAVCQSVRSNLRVVCVCVCCSPGGGGPHWATVLVQRGDDTDAHGPVNRCWLRSALQAADYLGTNSLRFRENSCYCPLTRMTE